MTPLTMVPMPEAVASPHPQREEPTSAPSLCWRVLLRDQEGYTRWPLIVAADEAGVREKTRALFPHSLVVETRPDHDRRVHLKPKVPAPVHVWADGRTLCHQGSMATADGPVCGNCRRTEAYARMRSAA